MSTEQTWQTVSTSYDDTLALAEQIGRRLRGGEVIELLSDLGGGKTAFVRGLAKGIGSRDGVRSPSFTLSNRYQAAHLTLHHFDFYRLDDPGILEDEIAELVSDEAAVIAVEWSDIIRDALPAERLRIAIKPVGENERQFDFSYPDSLQYLFEGKT